jgi:NAD(P)-dependent dehydrogenase (short-subunit alcohol dehydrogenase family)
MSMRLDNIVSVVTGGLSGIGAALAQRMVSDGATVLAADLCPLHMDVEDLPSVDRMIRAVIARYDRRDCMVHSAGIGGNRHFLQTMVETFDRIRYTLHCYARPEELAECVVYLCSSDGGFITRHVLVVDGGFSATGVSVGVQRGSHNSARWSLSDDLP